MNREELKLMLDKAGKNTVNIFGLKGYNEHGLQRALADDQCVLDKEGTKWTVYFYEKGRKHDQIVFDNENEACHYLVSWIIKPSL